jgi:SynChlorMet cassette radical SAM/SPASM protein ScmF
MAVERIQLPEGVPPLNTYYVYLTGGCNLACRHCWIAPTFQPNGGTGGHLDYNLFALAIDEGLPLGLNSVKLTGGEPLLHPDFVRMVDLLREKELGLTIETNGTLMTESLARYLKDKSTLGLISVSLDGANSETHDSFRGVKGSFERACQGIRNLVDLNCRPQLIMSVHSGNVEEIESLVRLAESLGAVSVKFNIVQSVGRGHRMSERGEILEIEKLIEMGIWVERALQPQVKIPLLYSWPLAFRTLRRLTIEGSGGFCSVFNLLGILPTGHLAMCGIGTQVPELCYGQLKVDHVADVWSSSPILVEMRHKLPYQLEGVCSKCLFQKMCLGYCVAENYFSEMKLTAPFWFCHQADMKGLFPPSRLRDDGDKQKQEEQ